MKSTVIGTPLTKNPSTLNYIGVNPMVLTQYFTIKALNEKKTPTNNENNIETKR